MSGFLDDREHAAENLFAHNEELLFLAHRAGVRDLALWATEEMGFETQQRDVYAGKLVDALVAGVRDDELLAIVLRDLEAAGKPALSSKAVTVFAQAVARASDELAGRIAPRPLGRPAADLKHHTHTIDASLSWRD